MSKQRAIVPYVKMHGCGNTCLLVDQRDWVEVVASRESAAVVRSMCAAATGPGADVLMVFSCPEHRGSLAGERAPHGEVQGDGYWQQEPAQAGKPPVATSLHPSHLPERGGPGEHAAEKIEVQLFNADGTRGGLCVNGLRCLAKHLYDTKQWGDRRQCRCVCVDGTSTRVLTHIDGEGTFESATVEVDVENAAVLRVEQGVSVDIANPHTVVFAGHEQDLQSLANQVYESGENNPPRNIHAVRAQPSGVLIARSHERGVGPTPACGSGAVAIALALQNQGAGGSHTTVRFAGGALHVEVEGHVARVTGPAAFVEQGEWRVHC